MKSLEQMGMNIGDFAESLMESGSINSKPEQRDNPAAPKEVPQKDISDVKVSNNFINSVLTESFGVPESSEMVAEEVVEPAPQQQLNEKILDLKEELKDTILKLTGIINEMLEMTTPGNVTGTGSIGPPNFAGAESYEDKPEPRRKKKKRVRRRITKKR